MKIPDSIKIMGHMVRVVKDYIFTERADLNGQAVYDANLIRLAPQKVGSINGISESSMEEIFLHECVHHIDHRLDIGLSEHQVRLLGEGFHQFLTDNFPVVFENR